MDAELLFRNFAERMQTKYGTYEEQLAALKLAEETKKSQSNPSNNRQPIEQDPTVHTLLDN